MKKRVNVTGEAFDKLSVIAAKLNVSGNKPNEKVENLFNEGVLFDDYEKIQHLLFEANERLKNIADNNPNIDEEQLKRLSKLQALGILNDDLSTSIKTLIDSFMEVKADEIKEAVLKI